MVEGRDSVDNLTCLLWLLCSNTSVNVVGAYGGLGLCLLSYFNYSMNFIFLYLHSFFFSYKKIYYLYFFYYAVVWQILQCP